jgi:hypothetical protein
LAQRDVNPSGTDTSVPPSGRPATEIAPRGTTAAPSGEITIAPEPVLLTIKMLSLPGMYASPSMPEKPSAASATRRTRVTPVRSSTTTSFVP